MRVLLLALTVLALTSCEPVVVNGTLNAKDKIVLVSKNAWGGKRTMTIPKAVFKQTQVTFKKHKVELQITAGGKTSKIDLKTKNVKFPSRSGHFQISAAQIGQKYSVDGDVDYSEYRASDLIREYEPCTYTEERYVCGPARCGEDRGCCFVDVDFPGVREREFYIVNYNRNLSFSFVESGRVKGTFKGKGSGSYKDYQDFGGYCERRGGLPRRW